MMINYVKILFVCAFVLLLTACGGDNDEPEVVGVVNEATSSVTTSTPDAAAVTTTPTAPPAASTPSDDQRPPVASLSGAGVRTMLWSPDGGQLLVSTAEGATFYNGVSFRASFTLENTSESASPALYSDDGMLIAGFLGAETVAVWSSEDGRLQHTLVFGDEATEEIGTSGFTSSQRLHFSDDNQKLLLIRGAQLFEWVLDSSATTPTVYEVEDARILAATYTAEGEIIVAGSADNLPRFVNNSFEAVSDDTSITLRNISTGEPAHEITDVSGPARFGHFVNNGQQIIVQTQGANNRPSSLALRRYDVASGDMLTDYRSTMSRFSQTSIAGVTVGINERRLFATSVAFSATGRSASEQEWLTRFAVWDIESGDMIGEAQLPPTARSLFALARLDTTNLRAANYGPADSVDIWSLEDLNSEETTLLETPLHRLDGFPSAFRQVRFGNNDTQVIVSSDYVAYTWDLGSGEQIASALLETPLPVEPFLPPNRQLLQTAHTRDVFVDGDLVAAAQSTVLMVRTLEADELVTALMTPYTLSAVRFSPAGDRLYAGSRDGIVSVWDYTTDTEELSFETNLGQILDMHMYASANRMLVVSALTADSQSPQYRLSAWDITSGVNLATIDWAADETVQHMQLNADGSMAALVVATNTGTVEAPSYAELHIRVFETMELTRHATLELPASAFLSNYELSFSSDNMQLAAVDGATTVHVWNIE